MVSITELQDIAEKEKVAEAEARRAKYAKDLAECRDKVRQLRPQVIDYIQERIIYAMKQNKNVVGLYCGEIKKIFITANKYDHGELLWFMYDKNLKAGSAYSAALKEEAEIICKELSDAGVKSISKNDSIYQADIYVYF